MNDGMAYKLVLPEKKHLFQIIFKRWHIFMDIVRAPYQVNGPSQ